MALVFVLISDVHYRSKDKEKIEKFKRKLQKLRESNIKSILVDLGDTLTNPEKLYEKRGHIYIPGNHDFEQFGVKYNPYRLHREYFETEVEGDLEKLLKNNGFGTDINGVCKNYGYKIFELNVRQHTMYFTHLRPNRELIEKLIYNSKNKDVFIFYGHLHDGNGECKIKEYEKYEKKVTEIKIPAFKDSNVFYVFYFENDTYKLKKFFIK